MMPTTIEVRENLMPQVSRAQAARLLEELRQAYQSLAQEGRSLIRMRFAKLARIQSAVQKNWEK